MPKLGEGKKLGLGNVLSRMTSYEVGEHFEIDNSTKGGAYSPLLIDGRYDWLARDRHRAVRHSWPSSKSVFCDAGTCFPPHGSDFDDRPRPHGIGAGTRAV